ncbi:tyrosine--tRNA ligase [Vampirovibrio sp.]|uniref:tyrosine--tRNA ligase n=1 Tax=Vampirovibrio sp. TaxID=2717857 RepID=UPI003594608B
MTSVSPIVINEIFLEQAQNLCRGGELLPAGVMELARKLQKAAESSTPLRVKLGLDPTRPDLHLGHTVVLRKLRAFQDLGHQAILIIGDATAMIGDPSGRSATRPPLTEAEIKVNAQTYLDQAGKVIDVRKAQVVRNSEWLSGMKLEDFLKLAAKTTVAQIIAREDFANRLKENRPISLHELFYPLMQGYDSVVVDADIELGGTDQRFNNLMGRELQIAYGREKDPQMVLLMPLLEGTDGKIKMSKSYPEHCINLTDTPEDFYGKLMSIPDPLLGRYEFLLGLLNEEQLEEQTQLFKAGELNPRDIKMHLAKYMVGQYHGPEAAEQAEQAFITKFQKRDIPEDIPELALQGGLDYVLTTLLTEQALAPSRNEARRLIQGGGVKLDGEKIMDVDGQLNLPPGSSVVLQVGKRKFLRLNFA